MANQRTFQIGKELDVDKVDGESIGMILFRGDGPSQFCRAVETALRDPLASKKWYLSVIDEMALTMSVMTCSVNGLKWCEVDFPADLKQAHRVVRACSVGEKSSEYLDSVYSQNRYAWG